MKNKLWILFLFLQISCSSTKQANTPVEKNGEKKISSLTLPVLFDFYPNSPHDTVVNWVNTFFNVKNIQMISWDKMTGLIKAEVQLATQKAILKTGPTRKKFVARWADKPGMLQIMFELIFLL